MARTKDTQVLNVISVDVEDYFHAEAFAGAISRASWDSLDHRVERNVALVLELFDKHRTRGTFFILGWVAQRFPHLVRQIAAAGHEIGCHGFAHQRLHCQTMDEFRADVRAARSLLMDLAQQPVIAFRAPSFSIVAHTTWGLDVLAEEGVHIDSSIFPVRHDLYGIPEAERFPHWHPISTGKAIFEFPPSTIRVGGNNFGVGGGGYLRFVPYSITRRALQRINEGEHQPVMVYFHPWELDPDQPKIAAPFRSRLRHYTNLSGMQKKLEHLLRDFKFSTITDVSGRLDAYKKHPWGAPGT